MNQVKTPPTKLRKILTMATAATAVMAIMISAATILVMNPQ